MKRSTKNVEPRKQAAAGRKGAKRSPWGKFPACGTFKAIEAHKTYIERSKSK